jgi:hypothetical protein
MDVITFLGLIVVLLLVRELRANSPPRAPGAVASARQPCEHGFVPPQGYDFIRLRDALDSGNAAEALTAASALSHVGLVEALELCLLLCDEEPERFGRAAVRWTCRYCSDTRAGLEEAQTVLAALGALRGPRREAAAAALSDLIYRRGLERASEAVSCATPPASARRRPSPRRAPTARRASGRRGSFAPSSITSARSIHGCSPCSAWRP